MKAADIIKEIPEIDTYKRYGRVNQVVRILIESKGPVSSIGDVCYIYPKNKNDKKQIMGKWLVLKMILS